MKHKIWIPLVKSQTDHAVKKEDLSQTWMMDNVNFYVWIELILNFFLG